MEEYLRQAGKGFCLQLIPAKDQRQFIKLALQWVNQQPRDWSLLMDNCATRQTLPLTILAAPSLRLSGRPILYFFHDLARSYHPLGNLARKFAFACLAPGAICNSQFTANHIRNSLVSEIRGILHEPLDWQQFNDLPSSALPPVALQPILRSGARVMLTPSRITAPGQVNDKNLRSLLPVLAHLKAMGQNYHGVVIGQDSSPEGVQTQALLEQAKQLGVADRFTVLPPTFTIQDYYRYADVVVTLSLREPFGRTVVEAIACGVPTIGSNRGGIGEILSNFAPEWTVDPNDPAAAAAAIVRVTADPNTPNILAQGKRWIETNCSIVDNARKLMEMAALNTDGDRVTLGERRSPEPKSLLQQSNEATANFYR
jgi:glycosyltransferase involved in cell wall biosynthesis